MLNWSVDFQIKTANGDPESTHGPTLAWDAVSSALHMVYLGSGGSNIWFSSCLNPQADLTAWTGNTAVKDLNATMTADSVPAMLPIQGKLTLLAPQKQVCNILQYTSGAASPWVSAGNTLTYGAGWNNPVMISFGSLIHLFICDQFANIWWFTSTGAEFADNGQILVKEEGAAPSAAVFNNQLYLLYWNTRAKVSALMTLPGAPNAVWQDLGPVKFQDNSSIDQGAAIVAFDQQLYVIYTYGKDPELWYANFFNGNNTKGELPNGNPVEFNNVTAKTTSSIAAIAIGNDLHVDKLCVVHKGESDKLYLTYATGGFERRR